MSLQYSTTHRTNAMAQLATDVGTSAVLKIWTGSPPANCAAADTGLLLVTFTLSASSFGTASGGALTLTGTPISVAAGNSGTAGYFRIYPSVPTSTNAVVQGTVGTSGADLNISNTGITGGQNITLNAGSNIVANGA